MKLAIVGSRTFCDYKILEDFITTTLGTRFEEIEEVISGGASGADTLAELFALRHGFPLKIFMAEWDKYGKAAGPIRNHDIITHCDECFAFWDGKSPGTHNDILLCQQMDKPCYVKKV